MINMKVEAGTRVVLTLIHPSKASLRSDHFDDRKRYTVVCKAI